jgi:pimeloyl-ACP methyl ester carboxylesterase
MSSRDREQMRQRQVTSIGLRTRALEAGDTDSEQAVVLLHGAPGSANHWDRLLSLIAPFGRAVALDLPGFGESDKPRDWDVTLDNPTVTSTRVRG